MIFKSLLRPLSTRSFPPRLCSEHIPHGHRKISFLPRIFHQPQPVGANGGGPPIRYTLTACIKSIFAAHAFYTYFYTVETGIGASMVPTISVKDDWFFINRSHRRGRNIRVGDIVMFDSVVVPGECAFKRVLGLEGDCVMIGTPGSGNDQMIRIPEGHCWLVGDNLEWSRDSRLFGPVPMALIKGKIIAKVLPWSESRWFEDDLRPVVDDP